MCYTVVSTTMIVLYRLACRLHRCQRREEGVSRQRARGLGQSNMIRIFKNLGPNISQCRLHVFSRARSWHEHFYVCSCLPFLALNIAVIVLLVWSVLKSKILQVLFAGELLPTQLKILQQLRRRDVLFTCLFLETLKF